MILQQLVDKNNCKYISRNSTSVNKKNNYINIEKEIRNNRFKLTSETVPVKIPGEIMHLSITNEKIMDWKHDDQDKIIILML